MFWECILFCLILLYLVMLIYWGVVKVWGVVYLMWCINYICDVDEC